MDCPEIQIANKFFHICVVVKKIYKKHKQVQRLNVNKILTKIIVFVQDLKSVKFWQYTVFSQ